MPETQKCKLINKVCSLRTQKCKLTNKVCIVLVILVAKLVLSNQISNLEVISSTIINKIEGMLKTSSLLQIDGIEMADAKRTCAEGIVLHIFGF